jgi:hypothetical protein
VQHFRIASDSEVEYDRPAFLPRALDSDHFSDAFSASADEFTDAEPDRFANPFDATPSRNLPSESPDEQELENTVREAGSILTRVANSATSILQNQILPAAQQVVATGQPYIIQLGGRTFKLTIHMARELLSRPTLALGLIYGFTLDNKMMPEDWIEMAQRVVLTGDPPPEYSYAEQMINLLLNMGEMGFQGALPHVALTWASKLGKIMGEHLANEQNVAPRALKAIAKLGMQSLVKLWSARRAVTNYHDRRPPQRRGRHSSESDHDPTAASSNQGRAVHVAPSSDSDNKPLVRSWPTKKKKQPAAPASDSDNKPLVRGTPASDSDNKPLAQTNPRRNQADIHRNTPGRVRIRAKKDIYTHLTQRSGRGMPAMTPALVNYAPGVRQSKRGGGKTIQAMAPILEFNEAADDPYLMRQQAH